MKISQAQHFTPSFKAATININALSDTHGELMLANNALEELRRNKEDVFCKEEKGNANVLAICGDWFMDGGRIGYESSPNKPLAKFQAQILNEFIAQIKGIAANTVALFTPGNHEFDGGVPLLDSILLRINADILMTNLDTNNSDGFKKSIVNNRIINEKIIEVEDDKDPNLKHKALFLGISPVNLSMYQKNLSGVTLTDNVNKPQKYVEKEDYKETLEDCKKRIAKFKQENPDGVVVLISHTGVNFADNLARESTVDIIFDGHEHKEDIRMVNDTPIIPLSQNFQKIVNARINIDDNGKIKDIRLKNINPKANEDIGPLHFLYHRIFKQDLRKKYTITSQNPDVKTLDTAGIRTGNNFLANFITDSVLEELQKKDSSIDFFALNASAIRHPLKISTRPEITPFDVMNVLAGIKEEDGKILTTILSGEQIAYMVADNLLFNAEAPEKNPIIHYAGLSIDKTSMLKALKLGAPYKALTRYIIDISTQQPISANKKYKMANVEKHFNKSQNPVIKAMKNDSEYTSYTVQGLFKEHFFKANCALQAKCDVRYV